MTVQSSLILNSPYAAPSRHWQPGTGGALVETVGRRPASYEIFDIRNNTRRSESLEMRHVEQQNRERLEPVFDEEQPIGSTRAMRTWYTTKTCHATQKSQISHMLVDSAWEQHAANLPEMDSRVVAYAKNDHLGCAISYLWNGVRRRYLPDFLIQLVNGKTLVLEIKGEDSEQNRAKRAALDDWVQAVNAKGGFGLWCWDVAFAPAKMQDILNLHAV
jgi:type III restriction enzyme